MLLHALHAPRVGADPVTSERVRLDGEARVPGLVAAAQGRPQTAYRAWVEHALLCADCVSLDAQCEAAQKLWAAFREARGTRP